MGPFSPDKEETELAPFAFSVIAELGFSSTLDVWLPVLTWHQVT